MVLIFVLGTIFSASFTSAVAQGRKAKVLLEVRDDKTYELVEDVLKEISHLQRPIRVLAAVGNARVGKSSMLNLINHVWAGRKKGNSVEEIFKTGDSFKQVTRNVWSHTIIPRGENGGSIVLLDVEGFNLGNDTVTKHLSMFTAMMSSCLNLFANDYLGNKDKEFLHEISRSSDLVFANKTNLRNFPKLHIVVRGNLKSPDDIESYVRDELFSEPDQSHDVTQSMADFIKKYFPRDNIVVSQIPTVNDPKMLQDLTKLGKSSHWNSFNKLINKSVKKCPEKIIRGSEVDGQGLVQLAKEVVSTMNKNSWKDFSDVFLSIEKDICKRSYEKHIKPVLQLDSRRIVDRMMKAVEDFKKECVVKSEVERAISELKSTVDVKRAREEEKRKKEEAEERKRKKEEEKRKKEESWFSYDNLKVAGGYVAGLITWYFFSDENLKSNVTILPSSSYNDIGLTGVCWKWNDIAQQKFGLTGEACGVIAQQVQKVYPETVLVGEDGFLQVRYGILREIINNVREQ